MSFSGRKFAVMGKKGDVTTTEEQAKGLQKKPPGITIGPLIVKKYSCNSGGNTNPRIDSAAHEQEREEARLAFSKHTFEDVFWCRRLSTLKRKIHLKIRE